MSYSQSYPQYPQVKRDCYKKVARVYIKITKILQWFYKHQTKLPEKYKNVIKSYKIRENSNLYKRHY